MSVDDAHRSGCPKRTDPSGHCECDALDEAMIVQASRPSAAELVRRAKAQGLIKRAQPYTSNP